MYFPRDTSASCVCLARSRDGSMMTAVGVRFLLPPVLTNPRVVIAAGRPSKGTNPAGGAYLNGDAPKLSVMVAFLTVTAG